MFSIYELCPKELRMVHVIYDFSTNFLYVNGLGDYLISFAFPLFRARLKKKRVMGKFDRPRLSLQTVGGRVSLLSLLPPCHITLRILPFSSIEVRDILQFVFFSLVILRTSDNNYISVNNACTMYTVRESEMSTVFNRFLSSGQYFHVRLIAPPPSNRSLSTKIVRRLLFVGPYDVFTRYHCGAPSRTCRAFDNDLINHSDYARAVI